MENSKLRPLEVEENKPYDSTKDTEAHIALVASYLRVVCLELLERAATHDSSKLYPPEKACFDSATQKLKGLTYGSDEYKAALRELKPALDHHYSVNSHHPEHFEHGIHDMNMIDLIEMLVDWKAATTRHADGDIRKSIQHNAGRFGYDEKYVALFQRTVDFLEEKLISDATD